jgi:chromosome segregation ATPase
MSKLYNEDGEEIEAFTKEEFDSEVKKATEEKESKVSELEKTIADLNEKIKGVDNKEANFKALREAKEKAEGQLSGIKEEFTKQINDLRVELNTSKLKEKISTISGGNEDVAKKIEQFYSSFQAPKDGEEDNRLDNAIKLAGVSVKSSSDAVRSGAGAPAGVGSKEEISPEVKGLGLEKFGLKEEDFKK